MDIDTYLWVNRIHKKVFAKVCNVNLSMLNSYIKGVRRPSYDTAVRISNAADGKVSVMELLSGCYENKVSSVTLENGDEIKLNSGNIKN